MAKLKKKAPTDFTFYGEKEQNFFLELSKEFSNSSALAKIILYRIDIKNTKSHSLYGESKAKNKTYLTPIELNMTVISYDIDDKFVSKEGINSQMIGKFTFGVYKDELNEKNCEIKRGDFVSYFDGEKERNFEVTNVSNISSKNSMLGYKPNSIVVDCTMVLSDVFKK
jgi:hypothetical protein